MAEYKTWTISELKPIVQIDPDDLLLISDKDHGPYYTKNMTMSSLYRSVINSPIVYNFIQDEIKRQLPLNLSAAVLSIIQTNSSYVYDSLDGKIDDAMIIGDLSSL